MALSRLNTGSDMNADLFPTKHVDFLPNMSRSNMTGNSGLSGFNRQNQEVMAQENALAAPATLGSKTASTQKQEPELSAFEKYWGVSGSLFGRNNVAPTMQNKANVAAGEQQPAVPNAFEDYWGVTGPMFGRNNGGTVALGTNPQATNYNEVTRDGNEFSDSRLKLGS